jgi:hypothetical protein
MQAPKNAKDFWIKGKGDIKREPIEKRIEA